MKLKFNALYESLMNEWFNTFITQEQADVIKNELNKKYAQFGVNVWYDPSSKSAKNWWKIVRNEAFEGYGDANFTQKQLEDKIDGLLSGKIKTAQQLRDNVNNVLTGILNQTIKEFVEPIIKDDAGNVDVTNRMMLDDKLSVKGKMKAGQLETTRVFQVTHPELSMNRNLVYIPLDFTFSINGKVKIEAKFKASPVGGISSPSILRDDSKFKQYVSEIVFKLDNYTSLLSIIQAEEDTGNAVSEQEMQDLAKKIEEIIKLHINKYAEKI
jgi:hypothetical protein